MPEDRTVLARQRTALAFALVCGGLFVTALHRSEWALVPVAPLLAACALVSRSDRLAALVLVAALLAAVEAIR